MPCRPMNSFFVPIELSFGQAPMTGVAGRPFGAYIGRTLCCFMTGQRKVGGIQKKLAGAWRLRTIT